MSDVTPIPPVIDDDICVRGSMKLSIRREGCQPETSAFAQEFLEQPRANLPDCRVMDGSHTVLNDLYLPSFVVEAHPHRNRRRAA